MKIFTTLCALLLTVFSAMDGREFPVQDVLDMASRDTEIRYRWIQNQDEEMTKRLRFLEIGNTVFLKEIIAQFGFPETSEDFELNDAILQLVLHSSDLEFQKEFLAQLPPYFERDEVATLEDRILLREGKKQKYGTHLHHVDGELIPYPIENPDEANALREEVGEMPLEDFLTLARDFDQAIVEGSLTTLYKIVFNMANDFYDHPDQYLYFASFEPDGKPIEEDGISLAFEDPALAAAFTLLLTTPVNGDITFEGKNQLVTLSPGTFDDALIIGDTPIYLNLVKKEKFTPHEAYGPDFFNRVYQTREPVEVVSQFMSDSPIETLILGGSKIRVSGMEMEYEYQDTLILKKIYSLMYFDITLENEPLM